MEDVISSSLGGSYVLLHQAEHQKRIAEKLRRELGSVICGLLEDPILECELPLCASYIRICEK